MTWERRVVDAILRRRALVLVAIALVTGVAGYYATRVGFDSDIETWFLEDDANLARYRAFQSEFGADEITVIGVFADDVFTPEILNAVETLTAASEEAPHVVDVTSITNVKVVRSKGPGHVAVEELIGDLPEGAEALGAIRDDALGRERLRGTVISEDGKGLAIVAELDPDHADFDGKKEMVGALRALAEQHVPPGVEWHITGGPVLDEAFFLYTERDFQVLAPISGLVVIFACLLLFRRFLAVIIPQLCVGLSCIWLFGLMGLLGIEITLISSSLTALVMAVGVADSVHVLSDYYEALVEGHDRDEAVAHATSTLLVPCLFTSTTTVAGFLSLLIGDLQPVREFGWLAAVGVMIAFFLSMTFIPCVLSLTKAPDARYLTRRRDGLMTRILEWLGRPTMTRARVTLAITGAVLAGAVVAVQHIDTDANPMNYFLPEDPLRVSMKKIDQELGGSTSLEFVARSRPEGLKDHAVLQRLDDFRQRVEGLPAITTSLSVLDSLEETRRILTEGESEAVPGPEDHPNLAAQLYLFLESDSDFNESMKSNYSLTRLSALVQMSEANLLTEETPRVDQWLAEDFSDEDLTIEVTGFIKLMSDMETYLFESQTRSLSVAFGVIGLMMFLLLRSFWLGLFAMIPNFVPILAGLAFMPLASIALDPGTVMIGSIALGLVVDDTVHYLVRLGRNLADHDLREAIARSMHQTGRPIVLTSLILAGGFGTLAFGSFTPNVAFGLVSAVVILMAVVADLVVLPAALVVLRPKVR